MDGKLRGFTKYMMLFLWCIVKFFASSIRSAVYRHIVGIVLRILPVEHFCPMTLWMMKILEGFLLLTFLENTCPNGQKLKALFTHSTATHELILWRRRLNDIIAFYNILSFPKPFKFA